MLALFFSSFKPELAAAPDSKWRRGVSSSLWQDIHILLFVKLLLFVSQSLPIQGDSSKMLEADVSAQFASAASQNWAWMRACKVKIKGKEE